MKKTGRLIGMVVFILLLTGCATIPREAIDLSEAIGNDLCAVHASYRTLVIHYFDGLRDRVDDFIDNQWKPTYLKTFIEKGQLAKLATDPDPDKVLRGVTLWADLAIKTIQDKRQSLHAPIDEDEKSLLESVDQAFNQLYQANAAVTAHLSSIRKVREQEDKVLETLRLRNLRDQIRMGMDGAAHSVDRAIEALQNAEGKARSIQQILEGDQHE